MKGIVGPIWAQDGSRTLLGVEVQDGHGGIHAIPTEEGVRRIVREELADAGDDPRFQAAVAQAMRGLVEREDTDGPPVSTVSTAAGADDAAAD